MSDVGVDKIRVVHVDDDPEIVELAATFLEREDERLAVEAARTADEALDRLESGDVHCVVSDYRLPDMDCASFAAAVRETAPGLPFVLFTGRDRVQLDDDLLRDDVTAYLQKGSGTDRYRELADAILTAVAAYHRARTDGGRPRPSEERRLPDGGRESETGAGLAPERRGRVLAGALDAVSDPVVVVDADGDAVHWNGAVPAVTGYDDADVAAMPPTDLFRPGDREAVEDAIETARTAGRASVAAALETRDGEGVPVTVDAERIADGEEGGTGAEGPLAVAVVAREAPTRAAYERELERREQRLEEIVSAFSHDLRNPLNVLTGRLGLARETGDGDHFDAMERSVDSIETLLDELVALARRGTTVEETEPVALADLVRAVWADLRTADATLTVGTERTVDADRERLRRMLTELLRNAVEHAGDDVSVTVGDAPDGFYVADDGPGIDAANRDRVWEYGHSTTRDGTGLGLAMVRHLAAAHGWDVGLTESEAGGARFEVTDLDGPTPPGS